MAKIDIIMPLYNKASVVMRGVESIRRQTFEDWRLIVVDDGSTDGSGEIVRRIDDNRIEVIRQENAGPGGARNTGIAHAAAEYIAFLDADDEWLEDYLADSIKALEENDVSVVASMFYEWPEKIDVTERYASLGVFPGRHELTAADKPEIAERQIFFLHVWNSVMKTEMARKYDGFYAEDKCKFAEDTVFFMRILANEAFLIIETPLVCHHREDSNLANLAKDPLAPFLEDPDVVLRYCPKETLALMDGVIDLVALRAARKYARRGYKAEAVELVGRFAGVKELTCYRRCAFEIATSRWFKYWVAFKCFVGPRVRLFLRTVTRKIGVTNDLPDFDEREFDE